jgi:hypothetical protein
MTTSLDTAIHRLQQSAGPALEAHRELRNEINLLFKTALVDPSMALARARRLLEVIVVDYYISRKSLVPPYRHQIKPLYNVIEELGTNKDISPSALSLCHAIRLEGNRILHYSPQYPGEPKWAQLSHDGLTTALRKLLEIAEMIGSGGHSVYLSSLPEPLAALYQRLHREWKPALEGKQEDQFPLVEALDLLFRSVVAALKPEWVPLLEQYANENTLPERIAPEEQHALRQLRNLGLMQQDGPWLFTPTRSHRIWPTPAGRVFLALSRQTLSTEAEPVAREVVQRLKQALNDQAAVALLEKVSKGSNLSGEEEKVTARRLRNLYLLTHETYFLENAEKLMLTDLGYYLLGKCSPD